MKWGYVGCEAISLRVQRPDSSAPEPGTNKSPAGHADTEKRCMERQNWREQGPRKRTINSNTMLFSSLRRSLILAAAALLLLLIKQIYPQAGRSMSKPLPSPPSSLSTACLTVSVSLQASARVMCPLPLQLWPGSLVTSYIHLWDQLERQERRERMHLS